MSDAFMAVDTGLTGFKGVEMLFAGTRFLELRIHGFEVVTVTALAGIGIFHRFPDPLGHGQAMLVEFLRGIHGPQDLVIHLVTGLNLTDHFVYPGIGNMAVRASGPNAGTVGVVDGGFVLLVNILLHLMAADTEIEGVGCFHGGIEATPEDDTYDEKEDCSTDGCTHNKAP